MDSARPIAAAQTVPVRGDVASNLAGHLALAQRAVAEGAEAVLFPELSLTGYELDLASELAFAMGDDRLEPLRACARKGNLTLVVGAPARVQGGLAIGAFVLTPDGGTQLYTKRHLGAFPASAGPVGCVPPAEASVFTAGELDPAIELDAGQAAVAVCADVGHASHAARAARAGARTYLASMFVLPADLPLEQQRLRTRSEEHGLAVLFANYGGPTGGLEAAGCSAAWGPDGALLAQLEGGGEGLVLASRKGGEWSGRCLVP